MIPCFVARSRCCAGNEAVTKKNPPAVCAARRVGVVRCVVPVLLRPGRHDSAGAGHPHDQHAHRHVQGGRRRVVSRRHLEGILWSGPRGVNKLNTGISMRGYRWPPRGPAAPGGRGRLDVRRGARRRGRRPRARPPRRCSVRGSRLLVTLMILAGARSAALAQQAPPPRATARAAAPAPAAAGTPPAPTLSDQFDGVAFRSIGPFRGGRVTAVAGVRGDPHTSTIRARRAAACGDDGRRPDTGRTSPTRFMKTGSVGAIAVAESDRNVIYVGMGEAPIRGNVSHGDGVYKSTDAGKTWTNVGLADTQQISRVRIDPQQPGRRLRRGAGPRLGTEPRPRHLPHARRRQVVEEGAVRRREDRRVGPGDGPVEPAHPLRRLLAGVPHAVDARERRHRAAASTSRPTAATPGRS